MNKILTPLIALLLAGLHLTAQTNSRTLALTNGNWFNGTDFAQGTWYVAGGLLTQNEPAKVDTTIDLAGRWVIPPLGDAHCSSVAGNPSAKTVLESYRAEGVFYLQVLSNAQADREAVDKLTREPGGPEIRFANGGITCTLGTPFLRYEAPAQNIRNPKLVAERYDQIKLNSSMLGDGYWFIDNKKALEANWKKILEQKPDILSIYLLDVEKNGGKEGKGLSAEMAKAVVKKAHRSKLRVYAHVETAEDVRLGIKLGVDGFANLPGNSPEANENAARYALNDADLRKLAKKQTPVIPLFSHAQMATAQAGQLEQQAAMFKRLLDNNVNVVIGSDDSQRTIRGELNYWFQMGRLDYQKALKILCENTPQAIYPDRRIGKLAEGYEASFLVLNDNPLINLLKIRAVSFMVQNGRILR